MDSVVPIPPSEQLRHATEADAALRGDRIASRANGVRITGVTVDRLDSAAERCLARLLEVDGQLDPIRRAPAVAPIFGSRRIAPLTTRPADPYGDLELIADEPDDPVANPELAIIPATTRFLVTMRMLRALLERVERSRDGVDIAFADPFKIDIRRILRYPVLADSEPDPVPDPDTGPAPEARHGYRYRTLADAATDTSLARESGYREDCFRQEAQWQRQVGELEDIVRHLDGSVQPQTIHYVVLSDKFKAAFHWMAGNRSVGMVAWCAACVRWAATYAEDVAGWVVRRANGADRPDGTDFPFADILNKMPDFFDLPLPAEARIE